MSLPTDTTIQIVVGILSGGGLAGMYATWRAGRTQDRENIRKSLESAQEVHRASTQAFELSLMQQVQNYQGELTRIAETHRVELRECREGHSAEIEKRIELIGKISYLEGQLKAMPMVPISFQGSHVQVGPSAPAQPAA